MSEDQFSNNLSGSSHTLEDIMIDSIARLNEDRTIYVLKGFNYWIDKIGGNFLFEKTPIMNSQLDIASIAQKLQTGASLFALHEDITWLNDRSLGGLPAAQGHKLVVVENDLFYVYYPHDAYSYELQELFEEGTDTIPQRYYGNIAEVGGVAYVAYNDLPNVQFSEMKLSELINGSAKVLNASGGRLEVPEEYDATVFSSLVTKIITDDINEISILSEKINSDRNVQNLKRILKPLGIRFVTRDYKVAQTELDSEQRTEYRAILQRKDSSYDFRDLKVYSDPYEGVKLADVNQVQIIDDVVSNAVKAQNNESFRDVFVTAPTGAGKSVMFQVPAIYLAEKHKLLTIVVSPLIGLMNDQVDNIKTMTNAAATINSSKDRKSVV